MISLSQISWKSKKAKKTCFGVHFPAGREDGKYKSTLYVSQKLDDLLCQIFITFHLLYLSCQSIILLVLSLKKILIFVPWCLTEGDSLIKLRKICLVLLLASGVMTSSSIYTAQKYTINIQKIIIFVTTKCMIRIMH